jgi:hypothetical protein
MRKVRKPVVNDDLRPEYDFRALGPGVRGKYYRRFQAGTNVAVLAPDVAKAFPTSEAVNEALRTVMRASRATLRRRRSARVVPRRRSLRP